METRLVVGLMGCEMGAFLESQKNSYELSNYDFACFGNYTVQNMTSGMDYDGMIEG